MGYRELTLKLPTEYTEEQLRRRIGKELKIRNFSCTISSKSLDARKKTPSTGSCGWVLYPMNLREESLNALRNWSFHAYPAPVAQS